MMDTDGHLTGAELDGEAGMALLTQIPDYDEDLEEAFIGPCGDDQDEAYDDEYEAESTAILEGLDPSTSTSSRRAVSGDTQLGAVPGSPMVQQLQRGLPR